MVLWQEMRADLWPSAEDEHSSEISRYFDGKSQTIAQVYIAEYHSEAAGFIELNIRDYAEGSSNPKVPFVEGWYVKPNFRKKGIGKALIYQAEQWAKSEGYQELASDTELHNTQSIAAHKQLGFVEIERVVCFLKTLAAR